MKHTVGSHSDDRGGESDCPCYCDMKMGSSTEIVEAENLMRVAERAIGPAGYGVSPAFAVALESLVSEKVRKARIDELQSMRGAAHVMMDYTKPNLSLKPDDEYFRVLATDVEYINDRLAKLQGGTNERN